jgi:uncharacterized protein
MPEIGTVARLRRYPVKSMRGEDLTDALVETHGLVGDRIYAYVLDNAPNPRFPWMTARQAAQMLLYEPKYLTPDSIEVQSPGGRSFTITDDALEKELEEKSGYKFSLKHETNGCHDSKPVSIISLQSISKLKEETGIAELGAERFRANIYADWLSGESFLEDRMIGKQITVGKPGVKLRIVQKDSRCVIPTLDPVTASAYPEVLETIISEHGGCIGVYAEVVSKGTIQKGDVISLD